MTIWANASLLCAVVFHIWEHSKVCDLLLSDTLKSARMHTHKPTKWKLPDF